MPKIICPSGLTGEVRALKVKEADALANQAAAKQGTSFEGVLSGCWTATLDPGPYAFAAGKPEWSSVLVCDRFYTLMRIRAATYGERYEFQVNKCVGCEERFGWELQLNELPVKTLPEESIAVFKNGNKFQAHLSDGRAVGFHLVTGSGEVNNARQARTRSMQRVTASLMGRIDEIDGVESKDKFKFINDLDMGEAMNLLEQFDAVDGGIETTLDIFCQHCGTNQEVQLPLDRNFWVPMKKQTTT